jgi:regulator of protease activity HflC (stomatin/prohibitin superfamily)
MAQSLHWEGVRMRLLIELPLTIAFFTLAVKYGWPYTVVFMLGYILAFNFKLTYLSRRAQVSTRFLVFLGIFLTFAMTASALIGRFFFSPNGQAWIEASRIWTFLLVTPALKVLWAAVIGFGLIALIAAVILIPYGQVAGQQMYSQYEQYKGNEGEAARTAINILLGISGGTWVVSGGQAELKGEQSGSLARFGGPGNLIIQEGHAVILEISGRPSRIVGRGVWWLEPFERISMVVPLYTRQEKVTVEQLATKDRIIIDEFNVLVFHKVDPGPPDQQTQDGLFAYNEERLRRVIWKPDGSDWRGGVRSVAETATRDVVGRFNLEEIITISDGFRTEFRETLTELMNRVTRPLMNVTVGTVEITLIRIPKEAQDRLLEKWDAEQQIQIAVSRSEVELVRGDARVTNLRALEEARAIAQQQMIMAISAGFGVANVSGEAVPETMVQLRFLEALEKIAEDPAAKLIFPATMKLAELNGLSSAAGGAPQPADGRNGSAATTEDIPIGNE